VDAKRATPLSVGETGGSKGQGEGPEGDHPICTESKTKEDRGYRLLGGAAATPGRREGQGPL